MANTTMAQRIKAIRVKLGTPKKPLSQQKAAERFGCSVARWSQWERGLGAPQGLYLEKMEKWFTTYLSRKAS